jgi:hypothetical protein
MSTSVRARTWSSGARAWTSLASSASASAIVCRPGTSATPASSASTAAIPIPFVGDSLHAARGASGDSRSSGRATTASATHTATAHADSSRLKSKRLCSPSAATPESTATSKRPSRSRCTSRRKPHTIRPSTTSPGTPNSAPSCSTAFSGCVNVLGLGSV